MTSAYKRRYGDNAGQFEMVSSRPIAQHVNVRGQESEVQRLRRLLRSEQLAAEARAQGHETFEEADDFDVPDDIVEPDTPYEEHFEPEPTPLEAAIQALERVADGFNPVEAPTPQAEEETPPAAKSRPSRRTPKHGAEPRAPGSKGKGRPTYADLAQRLQNMEAMVAQLLSTSSEEE